MSRVIDLSRGVSREQAMQGGFNQIAQGLSGLGQAMSRQEALELQKQKDAESKNIRNMQLAIDLSKQSGQSVTPEQAQMLMSGEGMAEPVDGVGPTMQPMRDSLFGNIAQRAQEERDYQKQQRALGTQLKQAQIKEIERKPLFEQQKELKAQQAEQKKWHRSVKKDLIGRKVKLQKEYSGLDRVFGNMDAMKRKFEKTGKLSAADQMQLVRSFVPLSEINPGVVRDAEFDTARDLGGKFGSMEVLAGNITRGQLLSPEVIKDMLSTTGTLKDVVTRGKESRFGDIADEATAEGLGESDVNLVLGQMGREILSGREKRVAIEERDKLRQKEMLANTPPLVPNSPLEPERYQATIPGMDNPIPYAPNMPGFQNVMADNNQEILNPERASARQARIAELRAKLGQ